TGQTGREQWDGLLTLTAWTTFVLACKWTLVNRSLKWLWLPMPFAVALLFSRPMTLGGLFLLWGKRIAAGDFVAAFSALMVPAVSTALVLLQRRTNRAVADSRKSSRKWI